MDWKKGVDVSSSLLFEDSADSETDASPDKEHVEDAIVGDDRDAESCSCDISCKPHFSEDLGCDDQDSGGSTGSDGDDHYEPITSGCKMCLSDVNSGCFSREEGKEETKIGGINKDEMEDWLFWETCMAVGYP